MHIRFVLPVGEGFFDREAEAVPSVGDTVRHHYDKDGRLVGPRLLFVREVVWDTFDPPEGSGLAAHIYLDHTRPRRGALGRRVLSGEIR
jgi:hypothetical protein